MVYSGLCTDTLTWSAAVVAQVVDLKVPGSNHHRELGIILFSFNCIEIGLPNASYYSDPNHYNNLVKLTKMEMFNLYTAVSFFRALV